MLNNLRVASYGPLGQGVAGYEAAKGDTYRPYCHLYYCRCGSVGYEGRPLRGKNQNRKYGGCCLHSLRTC